MATDDSFAAPRDVGARWSKPFDAMHVADGLVLGVKIANPPPYYEVYLGDDGRIWHGRRPPEHLLDQAVAILRASRSAAILGELEKNE